MKAKWYEVEVEVIKQVEAGFLIVIDYPNG